MALGCAVMRSPTKDIEELGQNDDANNYFSYLRPRQPRLHGPGRTRAHLRTSHSPERTRAGVCPLTAHIRRANPRDDAELAGEREHRLLRRGIPFGEPSKSTPQTLWRTASHAGCSSWPT